MYLYSRLPSQVRVDGSSVTSGVGAGSSLPHTSSTVGNAVGAVASATHWTVLLVATGVSSTADGFVVRSIVYVYVQS